MLVERVKEWNKQSLEKGLGRQEEVQQILQRQLEKKIGKPSGHLFAKLTQANEEQLIQWSASILSAESLDDIFEQ